jgi:hypothetical protein
MLKFEKNEFSNKPRGHYSFCPQIMVMIIPGIPI